MKNILKQYKLNHLVFWPPFLLLFGAVIISFINRNAFATLMNNTYEWLSQNFDWLYLILSLVIVFIVAVIFCTSAGKIRFGGENAKPKYSFFQWFTMSLCGGIAIGIVFWGVAEPIYFFAEPNNGIQPFSSEAILFSISQSFFHWSFTPYAIYTLATIPIALAVYNYNRKLSISSGLYFLIGEKCDGIFGKIVDSISLFSLAAGIATSLGFGIMQIGSGLNFIFGVDTSPFLWGIIAIFIVIAFTLSSILGVDKGIKWLSNQNFKLYVAVLIFIIIVGPTTYIFQLGVEGIGELATTFFTKSTYLGAANGEDWSRWWTVYYWAIWFAYAPVMGIFLTRLCYGRTIRQFIAVNLIAPAAFGIIWFTVFGGTAIHMQLNKIYDLWGAIQNLGVESAVFNFFNQLPLGLLLVSIFLVVIIISFVTMADSMTYVAAVMSTAGFNQEASEPPAFLKLLWGIIMGSLAWVMISFAGIDGAKMLAIVAAFPLLFLMIALIISAMKGLYAPNTNYLNEKESKNN